MSYLTEKNKIIEAIELYAKSKILWLDTEVADYQTTHPRLSSIQILANSTDLQGNCVDILDVLDKPELIDEFIQKIMLNTDIEKVFHNARYDLNFLGKSKAKNITCTLEIVKKIPYYLVPLPNRKLKTLAEQLCHFPSIDKTEQEGDWGQRPLTEKQLDYAKMDVVYLAQVHHRLLQLTQLLQPKPENENIEALILRYRQIEHHWKQLDSEIAHLKERLKKAMNSQGITELFGFYLSSQQRTTKKVSFQELAQITQAVRSDFDFSLTLTKELQKELGELLEKLPVEVENQKILQLKVQDMDEEDLPF